MLSQGGNAFRVDLAYASKKERVVWWEAVIEGGNGLEE